MEKTGTDILLALGVALGAAVSLTGCGQASQAGEDDPEMGGVEIALSAAPSDAACVRVTATGSRAVSRLFPLTPGATASVLLDRVPAGVNQLDAQAFSAACPAIAASTTATIPTWVAETPVFVRIDSGAIVAAALKLIRNGRVSVSIDFESAPWMSLSLAPVELAVIGDTPYGAMQITDFPKFIEDLNAAQPVIDEIVHLGDIKNGSSRCDNSYFQFVADNLNVSARPILFTPGDNEWTDCHRANNGAYDPLERLGVLRSVFFPVPGLSLGVNRKQVLSQAFSAGHETFVENQLWVEAGTVFTLVHVVGSNNSLLPWYGDDTTGTKVDDPGRRTAEVIARDAANLAWLDQSFAIAAQVRAAGVVVMMQADMWEGSPGNGFDPTVQKLAALTLGFAKPVLLIEGDSHVFKVDNPLAAGDAAHGVDTPVPNLTRMVVQGSTTAPLTEWVRVHVDPTATPPFSWMRNPR